MKAFIRLITKRSDGLTADEVRGSLRRSGLRSFYPEVGAFMARLDGQLVPANVPTPEERAELTPVPAEAANGTGRARLMKTSEMVERGLLTVNRPHHQGPARQRGQGRGWEAGRVPR